MRRGKAAGQLNAFAWLVLKSCDAGHLRKGDGAALSHCREGSLGAFGGDAEFSALGWAVLKTAIADALTLTLGLGYAGIPALR